MKTDVKHMVLSIVAALFIVSCGDDVDVGVAVGTLERDRIELAAEAFEPIIEILVREGDTVSKGDVILRLDTQRAGIAHASAVAQRDAATAFVAELETGPRGERITAARATLAGAQEAAVEAQRALERADALLEDKIISQARRDTASMQYAQSRATRDAARAGLDELEEGTRSEQLDQARANLRLADLRVEDAQLHLNRHEVRAPLAGVIEALPWEIGERPQAGRSAAVMLANGGPFARIYMPEAMRARVAAGAVAEVTVTGVDGIFEGRLRYVSSDSAFTPFFALTEHDRGKLTYLAEVDLIGPQARDLPTGLPVQVRFNGGVRK